MLSFYLQSWSMRLGQGNFLNHHLQTFDFVFVFVFGVSAYQQPDFL